MSIPTVSQLFESVNSALLEANDQWYVYLTDGISGLKPLGSDPIAIKNPYELDIQRFVPRQVVISLPRFLQVVQDLLANKQSLEGVVDSEQVKLVEDYTNDDFWRLGDEVIAYKIKSRTPANMNHDATARPQRKPLHSHDLRFASYPNKVLVIETRPVDHEIEFSVWSKSATIANRRALWLEDLFIEYDWVFQVQGVDKIWWTGRGMDMTTIVSGQKLHQRPLTFKVRLTEFKIRAYPAIRDIETVINDPRDL